MRKVPKKNYVLLGILTIITVLLVLYIGEWIETYRISKTNVSILVNKIGQVNSDELHMSLSESNKVILYVGYNHDQNVVRFEKELLKELKNENLEEYVIYYNVTDNDSYLEELKSEFPNIANQIKKAPMLIYVKNGVAIDIKDSNEKIININDFRELVTLYEIGK